MAVLNLGGVGNLTYVDPICARPEDPGALLAFDTGVGNAPMDDLCQTRLGQPRDNGGTLAAQGTADDALVAGYLAEGIFSPRAAQVTGSRQRPGDPRCPSGHAGCTGHACGLRGGRGGGGV